MGCHPTGYANGYGAVYDPRARHIPQLACMRAPRLCAKSAVIHNAFVHIHIAKLNCRLLTQWRIDMSEQLRKLSQSIVEVAKAIDGHLANYGKNTSNEDTAAVVGARLALDRLLEQSKSLDELLYKLRTEEIRKS